MGGSVIQSAGVGYSDPWSLYRDMEKAFIAKNHISREEFEEEDYQFLFSIEYPEYIESCDPFKLQRLEYIHDHRSVLRRIDHIWQWLDEDSRDEALSHYWLHPTSPPVKRVGDKGSIRALLADPDTGRWFEGLEDQIDDPANIVLRHCATNAHAIFVSGPRSFQTHRIVWEAHLILPPEHRGKEGVAIAKLFLEWFDERVGHKLTAKCDVQNRRVFHFMPSIGFHYRRTAGRWAYFARNPKQGDQ